MRPTTARVFSGRLAFFRVHFGMSTIRHQATPAVMDRFVPAPALDKYRTVAVMPAYNAAVTLHRTVGDIPPGSVDEVVLVDDCSSDNTHTYMRTHAHTHTFTHAHTHAHMHARTTTHVHTHKSIYT